MTERYELSDERWHMIEDIVSPPQVMGRPRRDDRQVLNGIFWILCSGAKWRDPPERYGPWKSVYQRFRQRNVVERLFNWLKEKCRSVPAMTRWTLASGPLLPGTIHFN